MKKPSNFLRAGLPLGLATSLSGCSDATQFTEKASPLRESAIEVASPQAETTADVRVPGEGDNPSEYAAPQIETESESSEITTTGAVFTEATSAGSGINTNDTTPTGNTLTEAQRDALIAQCSQGTPLTITRQIRFPRTDTCRWNQDGNLARRNAYLQAAEAQSSSIQLPANAQLCSMSLASQSSTLHYDDFIILTLNGYVLLSSNQKLTQNLLGSAQTAFQWDFSRVRGKAVDFDSPAYCLGSSGSACQVPVTDVPGQFRLDMNPQTLLNLADRVYGQQNLNFSLIATGDNDDLDCFHTDMTLEFTLQYTQK